MRSHGSATWSSCTPSSAARTRIPTWWWAGRGEGLGNFLSFGDLPSKGFWDTGSYLIPRGVILNRDLTRIHPIDLDADNEIQEFVSHAWYRYSQGDEGGRPPFRGETELNYTGPKPPYQHLDVAKKYSWMKSPRWQGRPMEVGPLARGLMLYAGGNAQARELVDATLKTLGPPGAPLFSTLGPPAAPPRE